RSRQSEFELAPRVGTRDPRLRGVHAPLQLQRAGDGRHYRLVAVGADAHLDFAREIDAIDRFEKAVNEMLARLLAVGDDVDAAVLLRLQRKDGGVALRRRELGAAEPPRRPQPVRLSKPCGLRQASGNGGREHRSPPYSAAVRAVASGS